MLVLRHLTMRCWSQRRTAAPLKPIPTETAVKRVSVLDQTRAVGSGLASMIPAALVIGIGVLAGSIVAFVSRRQEMTPRLGRQGCQKPPMSL